MSAVRVAVAGAGGRMGRALLEAATSTDGVRLASALDVAGTPWAGRDAGDLCGAARGITIDTDVAAALRSADVLIDFTRPEGTLGHVRACQAARCAIVGRARLCAAARGSDDAIPRGRDRFPASGDCVGTRRALPRFRDFYRTHRGAHVHASWR